jgi:dipeptidyl aminopeptidase/acylaminoacyl peptidase
LESDQPRLFLYERRTGRHINLSEELDRPVESYIWNPDSRSLWVTLEDRAQGTIVKLDVETKKAIRFVTEGSSGDVQISNDGKTLVFSRTDFSHPADLYRLDLSQGQGATPTAITHLNAEALRDIEFGETRSFTFPGWHGEPVQCWEVKPPGFESTKKYPVLLLMHGGPENCWINQFHYRWNAQLFAAAGYVTILPNFHGSTSFGLRFMDAIKGQWGGAPFVDQMLAVDEALKWQYVDGTRLAAAGASYGGYMANWMEGHTDRFRTIVSHDGLYDLLSALYACDFPGGIEKEFKGAPWTNQNVLIEQSPVSFAKNFKTPMLIIHGEKDYRVDPSSGYAMFQLLQAMKIPSKLLFFPDENHWVLKPANSILWYHTVLEWLDQWVKPDQSECDNLRRNWPHR